MVSMCSTVHFVIYYNCLLLTYCISEYMQHKLLVKIDAPLPDKVNNGSIPSDIFWPQPSSWIKFQTMLNFVYYTSNAVLEYLSGL